jgi:hypothetical protein
MHIEKNICENLLCTLLNVPGKTKNTHNARLNLYNMGIRHHLHLQEKGNNSVSAPPTPYVLGKDQKVQFCKFLKGIKFPDGYAANLASTLVKMDRGWLESSRHILATYSFWT